MEKMVDPFWLHVKDMDDGSGRKQCVFCGHPFAPKTSISRIKHHLSGEGGHGVAVCKRVPNDVRGEAFRASKRQKRRGSSSNTNHDAGTTSTCPRKQHNGVENLGEDIGRVVQSEAQGIEPTFMEDRTPSIAEAGDHMRDKTGLGVEEEDIQGLMDSLPVEEMELNLIPERFMLDGQLGPLLAHFNGLEDLGGCSGGVVPSQTQGAQQRPRENRGRERMMHIDRSISPEMHMIDACETRGDACPTTDLVNQLNRGGFNWEHIFSHSMGEEDAGKKTGTLMQSATAASSSGRPLCINTTHETRGDALPTSSLVGEAFEQNRTLIWSWLMDDEVFLIGVYGMGGIGKTALMKHINNRLLDKPNTFSNVYWISASQDFSIGRLQNRLAKCIGLDLSNEDDELSRATKLFNELQKKHKWVLILDDLWNYFDPEKVGIPIEIKGCKLILTTRSLKVCQGMRCEKKFEIKRMSEEDAWSLFLEKLIVHDVELPPKILQVAKSVLRECAGLPLGIVTMAGSMRGVDDLHEWRNTWKKLKESKVKYMKDEVFQILRFSYDHLNDLPLQQCFLYCTLFPEDWQIERIELISYLIDEGIIEEMNSRQEEFDEGHSMLNMLENVCLLERCLDLSGALAVKMHDLIRDMALQIQQENSQIIIKAGKQLKELPYVEEWKENLERVSLMEHQINEIPSNHSPRCPNLSTLLLRNDVFSNRGLYFIADSFFKQLLSLKVLDLSYTNLEILPDSISDLVVLRALLLKYCKMLRHVPSLKKLKALRRLDLEGSTALENRPWDMEWPLNLRYLKLSANGEEEFPVGILPKLSQLQVFVVVPWVDKLSLPQRRHGGPWVVGAHCPAWVKGKELACLTKLETLQCQLEHFSDLTEYLESRDETQSMSAYFLLVGQVDKCDYDLVKKNPPLTNKAIWMSNISIRKDRGTRVKFPTDINELWIYECNDVTSLCDASPSIKYATELEVIEIHDCQSMESLISSSFFHNALRDPFSNPGVFSSLKEFRCYLCNSMKKVFPLVLLPNLEEIRVAYCQKVEDIIGTADEDEESTTELNLPNLRILDLDDLPELKSICHVKLRCNSLQEINIYACPKLKRMPISLRLLDDGQPSPPPSLEKIYIDPEWWKSVEWDHPEAKNVLVPFVSWRLLPWPVSYDEIREE